MSTYNNQFWEGLKGSQLFPYQGIWPVLADGAVILPGSRVIGAVSIGCDSSVWYNAVVRADVQTVTIGKRSNVQDGCVLHVTHDTGPLLIGDDVTIGHAAVLHACSIGNRVLIGMNATVLDGAILEDDCMVAAGAVLRPGTRVPRGYLAAGVPAKVVRALTELEISDLAAGPLRYVGYANKNLEAVKSCAQTSV